MEGRAKRPRNASSKLCPRRACRRHLSWELRAATSLAGLWRDENKTAAAHQMLSGEYDRFTEGLDTLDLGTARTLIDELA